MTMNQKDLLVIYLQLQNEHLCSDFHQILFQDILIKLNIIDNVDKKMHFPLLSRFNEKNYQNKDL